MSKSRNRESKSTTLKRHFCMRLFQRYNIQINRDQYNLLCSYISLGKFNYPDGTKVEFVDKQSNMKQVYSLYCPSICKEVMLVIWDKSRRKCITVLPKDVRDKDMIIWEKFID